MGFELLLHSFVMTVLVSFRAFRRRILYKPEPSSHARFVRDISLTLNMTEYFSHSVLDTESVSLMFL